MNHRAELTGLRSIAVGMVVLEHSAPLAPGWWGGPFSPVTLFGRGEMGVHIFFVLSGFLISSLLLREYERSGRIGFWAFYRRRLLRISPAFYAFLAVMAGLSAAGLIDIGWQQQLVAGTYMWNYAHMFHFDTAFALHPDGTWYLGHTWSLALEEQFYWAWPALLWCILLRRDTRWLLPAVILAVPLVRMGSYLALPDTRAHLAMMFHTSIDSVMIGCFFALHRTRLEARLGSWLTSKSVLTGLAVLLIAILPNATVALRGYWLHTYGRTLEAALIGMMVLCLLAQPDHWAARVLRSKPCVFIGTISYSLYLWQQPFSYQTSPLFWGFPFNMLGAVIAATLSYVLVERPFLILKDRKARDRAAALPAQAPSVV